MLVNELIKSYRIANSLTQYDMAEKLSMTKQTYARMEKGETRMTDDKLNGFARLVNKTPFEIREMANAGRLFPLLQENENHAQDTASISNLSNLTVNNYFGDNELSLRISNLNTIIAEKDKLLQAKDEQIATLQALVNSLQNNQ